MNNFIFKFLFFYFLVILILSIFVSFFFAQDIILSEEYYNQYNIDISQVSKSILRFLLATSF